jgi:signal transduction histidine kinase
MSSTPSGRADLTAAAERTVATALQLLGGRRVCLYRCDPTSGALTTVAEAGGRYTTSASTAVDAAIAGRAVLAGEPVIVPDVLTAPDLSLDGPTRDLVATQGTGARAAVPLSAGGDVIGLLVHADRRGRIYTEQDRTLLSVLGGQAALALEASRVESQLARQYEEARELARIARLVNETLDLATAAERIADSVLGLLGVHSSAIRLFRPDGALGSIALGGRAKLYAGSGDSLPPGIGLAGQVAVAGRTMWTADIRVDDRFELSPEIRERNAAAGIVAGLAVPLRVAESVIGVLSVGSPTPRLFTQAEISLLETFADHAVVALDNARSREALTKQTARLQLLHEIDRAMLHADAPVAIAQSVLPRLRDLLGVPRAIVNLFDFENGHVEWLAAVGRHRLYEGPPLRYPLGLAGDLVALRRGEPQIIDTRALPPSPHSEALLASGVDIYMVVPMVVGDNLIGSVSFGGAEGTFPAEQVAIAQEVAAQLAIAIAQARLHEQVARQAGVLEQRVQERTRELEAANQELDAFSYSISHDLRAPLRAMQGFTEALLEDYGGQLDGVGHDYAKRIVAASRRMDLLIQDLLAYSRLSRTDVPLDPVDTEALVDEVLSTMSTELAQREAEIVVDRPLSRVRAHRAVFGQILTNLVTNAVKFVAADTRPRVRFWSERRADRVRLWVEDNGIGIAPEHQQRIFQAFQRLHGADRYPGTGIGLAIVQRAAGRLGGRAGVESTPGVGSRFWVELASAESPISSP